MKRKKPDWQAIAEAQAIVIEELAKGYKEALFLLSQYGNIDAEEKRLKAVRGHDPCHRAHDQPGKGGCRLAG